MNEDLLYDRNDDDLEGFYGCECDYNRTCSVAECQMNRDLEWHVIVRKPSDDPWEAAALASGAVVEIPF